MTNKYSFAIDNVEMIDENPNSRFAILSLDFFASGKNLHDLWVSEDTLLRTADTIKNCPIVWKYDEVLDDVYTHDDEEVPCGFVPETSSIKAKKLEDGRTMLSTNAYVWKRYTGPLLNIFKRDGGKKPVSVEMSVYGLKPMEESGLHEIIDYRFEGITILGSYVRPAIPGAMSTVVSFDIQKEKQEYLHALEEELSSKDIRISSEFIEEIKRENLDDTLLTFPYKSKSDMNPALKGISPPISLGQANEIARQADAIGNDKEKNGWAIAISNFKKTHKVENGKWVKKTNNMSEENSNELGRKEDEIKKEISMNKDEITNKDKLAEQTEEVFGEEQEESQDEPQEEQVGESQDNIENFQEDEKESPEEEDREEDEEENKKGNFQYPENFDMEEMGQLFADDEEDEDIKMAKEELAKGTCCASPQAIMSGMFAQMKKMAKALKEMAEKNKVYMEENEKLRQFKQEVEDKNKQFEVMSTIKELKEKVVVPEEAEAEMIAEAEKYSIENLEEWKTYCKAKSFDFAIKEKDGEEDVVGIGMPFAEAEEVKRGFDLWADD